MPLWPFGRKKQRASTQAPVDQQKIAEADFVPSYPRNATPRARAVQTPEPATYDERPEPRTSDSQRKRRRSTEKARDTGPSYDYLDEYREKSRSRPRRSTDQDITALPPARKSNTSPHLRSVSNAHSSIQQYDQTSTPKAVARHSSPMIERDAPRSGKQATREYSQQHQTSRRVSKKQERDREQEVKAMSSPVSITKRSAGHGDMLRRDSKKARRIFSGKTDDPRGSTISLPFQDSIHSSMSGLSERKGWQIGALDFLNPRPTIRYSMPGSYHHSANYLGTSAISRNDSKKGGILPALKEDAKPRDRRRVADLADNLDASDLRLLLERDSKRADKNRASDRDKLDRKLRKRAEKERVERGERPDEERRGRELPAALPPTAIHPAFRDRYDDEDLYEKDGVEQQGPPTPVSVKDGSRPFSSTEKETYHEPPVQATQNPFNDPQPATQDSPFADPIETKSPTVTDDDDDVAELPAEMVVGTAQAVRLSQGRLSQASMSPPRSPITAARGGRNESPLRREFNPDMPIMPAAKEERRQSDSSAKRAGTWAQFFRRGPGARGAETEAMQVPASEASFSNTSRESMSRQPLPAHLVQSQAPQVRRRSGTPTRTQSRFREDLPELPASPPDSRVQSPDLPINTANVAAARRGKTPAEGSTANARGSIPESLLLGRTDSPVDKEESRDSATNITNSLASVDSEGAWLTGRPSKRVSHQSQLRNSIGSLSRQREEFSASYEDLGMPEDEYFRKINATDPDSTARGASSMKIIEPDVPAEGDTLTRRDTNRRKPTLVHRDPLVKSREGLLTDYQSGEAAVLEEPTDNSGSEYEDSPERENIEAATFYGRGQPVEYGKGHARHLSTGSAKLLDIPANRSRRESPDNRSSIASPPQSPRLPHSVDE